MCEPQRLIELYKLVIEQGLGFTAQITDDDRAILIDDGPLTYVVRNRARDDPSLLDVALYLPHEEARALKDQACRAVATVLPCLRAWVDDDGDIVLNVQTMTGPAGMLPSITAVKDLLPRTIAILRYAANRSIEEVALAGILHASNESGTERARPDVTGTDSDL
jgi:hypothetical protein